MRDGVEILELEQPCENCQKAITVSIGYPAKFFRGDGKKAATKLAEVFFKEREADCLETKGNCQR